VIRRVGLAILLFIGASILIFLVTNAMPRRLPVGNSCGVQIACTQQTFNVAPDSRPLPIQYLAWMGGAVHWDFGKDVVGYHLVRAAHGKMVPRPVTYSVAHQLDNAIPASACVLATAFAIWSALSWLGGYAGRRWSKVRTKVQGLIEATLGAVSPLILALLMIFLFAVHLRIFPTGRAVNPADYAPFLSSGWWNSVASSPLRTLADLIHHLVLPALTLALIAWGVVLVGSNEEMAAGFEGQARVLAERLVILLGWLIVIETVFSYPGIGGQFFADLRGNDIAGVRAILLLFAFIAVVAQVATNSLGLLLNRAEA
jgi:peptide/nickel transport system permease protein